MPLTDTQKQKLLTSIRSNWKNNMPSCIGCGAHTWEISDSIFELREFQGGNLVVGGSIYPVIPISCATCGYVMFLNALKLKIIDQNPPQ